MFYTYILKSDKTSRFYIGYTGDMQKRLNYHNQGKNVSTKHGSPWRLVYKEEYSDKKSAWLREKQIKNYKCGEAFRKLVS